jgi:sulfate adenylyltransferase
MYKRLSPAPVPPRPGCCIWFTGLSGAGKSTTAVILARRLEAQGRTVTVLDGDIVRTHLSRGLGFSKQDRDANVRRIGFVAAEVVRHGGIAICAAISPYRDARAAVRAMIDPDTFCEVYVSTDLATCERRDPKGMYAAARRGEIKAFTGVDDPYEPPLAAELVIDTLDISPEDNAERVLAWLRANAVLERQRVASAGPPPVV